MALFQKDVDDFCLWVLGQARGRASVLRDIRETYEIELARRAATSEEPPKP